MKKKYLIAVLLVIFFSCFNVLNAQFIEFTDDMEYPTGIPTSSYWWDCSVGCPIIAGPDAGHNSDYAGFIPDDGTTDVILNLDNKIFGTWFLDFYMYVPSNKEASFNLQGEVPVTTGESMVGNFIFNPSLTTPGQGFIDAGTADPNDDTYFDFPHDEWFRVVMGFDINAGMSAATWVMWVDNIGVVQAGTPLVDGNGNIPSHLGGVNYFSGSSVNSYYLDDIIFSQDGIVASVEDNSILNFTVYPNPADDSLNILYIEEIKGIKVFDLHGRLVIEGVSENIINVSELTAGPYFIELSSISGKSVQKFIKE